MGIKLTVCAFPEKTSPTHSWLASSTLSSGLTPYFFSNLSLKTGSVNPVLLPT
jgi:hypothetical protein